MVIAGLSAAGLPTDRFAFEGFVPAKAAARRAFFAALRAEPRTLVCFEAGRRLAESLRDLADALGARPVVIAREVSKIYEDFVRGDADELAARGADLTPRGEVTLFIGAAVGPAQQQSEEELRAAISSLRGEGLHLKEIAKRLAKESGWSAREIYRLGLEEG
jgi:16S rRNA (cytidine1402-2'-O)-methyltransferase